MNAEGATNALTKVTSREDDNGCCRTAIQTESGKVNSIDVLTPQGELFYRLNITVLREESNWGNIDVVWSEKITGTVKAWSRDTLVLNVPLRQYDRISVDMRKDDPK